jgi:C-terminal processing protease CtpA/Prc
MSAVAMAAMLAGCGGGGSETLGVTAVSGSTPGITPTPMPSGTATVAGCSLRERQDWAAATLREWYLFPDTLPASLDPTPYTSVGDYIDALTATARAQNKDRYFSYLTSIASEDSYYSSGTSAGLGVRLAYAGGAQRLFVTESFEGAPALAAGIDRGAEIVSIGTSSSNLQSIASLVATQGSAGITAALGPDTAGTTRVLRVTDNAGTRNVTVTKASYNVDPVSTRYGAQVISDAGQKFGYVNLRNFINPANPALRAAFQKFKDAGVSNVVVDLRYNGGGLISIAELVGDLLGGARNGQQVEDYTVFRPEKASNNTTRYFQPQPQSIAPTRVAFIGFGGTASASELVINAQVPYLHANAALIGSNTYGKPVGQVAIDRAACDDRFRVIALAVQNANHVGNYYTGLAGTVEASCQANDDINYPLGDPREGSTRAALDFLEGKSCTRIAAAAQTAQGLNGRRDLLTPDHPTTVQREVPGLF